MNYRVELLEQGHWSWRHFGGREQDNTFASLAQAEHVLRMLIKRCGFESRRLRIVPLPSHDTVRDYQVRRLCDYCDSSCPQSIALLQPGGLMCTSCLLVEGMDADRRPQDRRRCR